MKIKIIPPLPIPLLQQKTLEERGFSCLSLKFNEKYD
jgi:hypothetical protein